ncbi:hypothetical protein GcM1_082003 [Golovinomyces cichoracearum]|uniref:Uncharacterized protein n=1 Tax=Golovinomyces cichoracearum TaxID=62708 RepID=A0A420JCE8_9PEZI|nr:hypothetical protein GcM1_082003 [Golovinomyces cichoracearum]
MISRFMIKFFIRFEILTLLLLDIQRMGWSELMSILPWAVVIRKMKATSPVKKW